MLMLLLSHWSRFISEEEYIKKDVEQEVLSYDKCTALYLNHRGTNLVLDFFFNR